MKNRGKGALAGKPGKEEERDRAVNDAFSSLYADRSTVKLTQMDGPKDRTTDGLFILDFFISGLVIERS